jgi:hypothetical protein
MSLPPWKPLAEELDRWNAAGRRLALWLRDDDAVAPSPALDRLSRLAEDFGAPVLLAVIPMQARPDLAPALRAMPQLLPCQHGVTHRNHAAATGKKSEFGPERPAAQVDSEIAQGQERLHDLLGDAVLPVFVPPWNRIDPGHASRLGTLGFRGLSCFRNYRHGADGGPPLINTDLDVMNWQGGRIGRTGQDLLAELLPLLAQRRLDAAVPESAFGLLLHHRDHDETAWTALRDLLSVAAAHPAVRLADPRSLLA